MNGWRSCLLGLSLVLACAPLSIRAAEDWPVKPIRVVVPFSAGSGVDTVARAFADGLGPRLKTHVVVENRNGAGGTVGANVVKAAQPDGYSLLFTANPPFLLGPTVQGTTAYDPIEDFVPVAKVAATPMVLIASTSSPFRKFDDLVAAVKEQPGALDFATTGIGTPSHLSIEVIKRRLGLKMEAVHYKDASQAMTDTLAGHVPVYMPSFPAAQALIKSGQVRALAIGSPERSAAAPDIPTLAEVLKAPGLESRVWYGFLAPKGTPPAVVQRLEQEIAAVGRTEAIQAQLMKIGADAAPAGAADFARGMRGDFDDGMKLLRDLGIVKN